MEVGRGAGGEGEMEGGVSSLDSAVVRLSSGAAAAANQTHRLVFVGAERESSVRLQLAHAQAGRHSCFTK